MRRTTLISGLVLAAALALPAATMAQDTTPVTQPAESPAAPGEQPAESPAAAEPEQPAEPGEPRVIQLLADAALRFTDLDGTQVTDIPVTPGETILFQIDNTSGFAHNFWIGTDSELMMPNATTDVGIPDWETGVQELEWVLPADISGLKYGCTVPGHYSIMQGTFSAIESAGPAAAEPAADESAGPAESAAA